MNFLNDEPRGFAFVDYETVEEAEQSQEYHDGTAIGDSNIRETFCTPGKTARDIFGKFDEQVMVSIICIHMYNIFQVISFSSVGF